MLGEFSRLYDDVTYFPGYEMVSYLEEIAYFPGDLRHVKRAVVDMITQSFVNAHLSAVEN